MKNAKTHNFKWLSVLLAVVMIVAMIPMSTVAATETILTVNGTDVTTDATVDCGEGTAVYTRANNTLTLNNVTIDTARTYGIQVYKDLTIVVNGENTIKNVAQGINAYASSTSTETNLTLQGEGTLNIETNSSSGESAGVRCDGLLTINDVTLNFVDTATSYSKKGAAINVSDSDALLTTNNAIITIDNYKYGISSHGDTSNDDYDEGTVTLNETTLNISGDLLLQGIANPEYLYIYDSFIDIDINEPTSNYNSTFGINFYQDAIIDNSIIDIQFDGVIDYWGYYGSALTGGTTLWIQNNSELNLVSTNENSYATLWSREIIVDNSTLTASNNGYYDTIVSAGFFTIKNGAAVESTANYGNALYAYTEIYINNSTVDATSYDDCGIVVEDGDLTITGVDSVVSAKSTNWIAIQVSYSEWSMAAPYSGILLELDSDLDNIDTEDNVVVNTHNSGSYDYYTLVSSEESNPIMSNGVTEITIQIKDADYTDVDAAIASVPTDMSDYTDDSVQAVTDAVDAVVTGKNITEQSTVDGYADAITDAIDALTYKDADYSAVDEAIATADALDATIYSNFDDVTDAIDAVVEGKNITEQDDVDAMAKAITDAIAALVEVVPEFTVSTSGDAADTYNPQLGDGVEELVFTEEELSGSDNIDVILNVAELDLDTLDEEDQTLITDTIESLSDNAAFGFVLDISLEKWINDNMTNITELDDVITITIDIPEEYQAEGRVFSVIRIHDGEVTVLDDLDDDDTTITFQTDCFSTYAVSYTDEVAEEEVETEDADGVETGDSTTALPIALSVIAMAGMVVLFKKRSLAK